MVGSSSQGRGWVALATAGAGTLAAAGLDLGALLDHRQATDTDLLLLHNKELPLQPVLKCCCVAHRLSDMESVCVTGGMSCLGRVGCLLQYFDSKNKTYRRALISKCGYAMVMWPLVSFATFAFSISRFA